MQPGKETQLQRRGIVCVRVDVSTALQDTFGMLPDVSAPRGPHDSEDFK